MLKMFAATKRRRRTWVFVLCSFSLVRRRAHKFHSLGDAMPRMDDHSQEWGWLLRNIGRHLLRITLL